MQAKISDSPSGALDFVKAADVVLGAWAKVRVQTLAVLELATSAWPWLGLINLTNPGETYRFRAFRSVVVV